MNELERDLIPIYFLASNSKKTKSYIVFLIYKKVNIFGISNENELKQVKYGIFWDRLLEIVLIGQIHRYVRVANRTVHTPSNEPVPTTTGETPTKEIRSPSAKP